ncbi:hypothetical protein V8C37DRAFT_370212 [Trichoderma ceciliae]
MQRQAVATPPHPVSLQNLTYRLQISHRKLLLLLLLLYYYYSVFSVRLFQAARSAALAFLAWLYHLWMPVASYPHPIGETLLLLH